VAGLIARLFGAQPDPAPGTEPAPGLGGYTQGAGPANQTGFPGSTSQVRTRPSNGRTPYSPRDVKINADYDTDANNRDGSTPEVRQASFRGDVPGAATASPRSTSLVVTRQTAIRQLMQNNSPAEFYGGPMLRTGAGNNTAGGETLSAARQAGGHSATDTTTRYSQAQPGIAGDVPGGEKLRNTVAQKVHNPPGQIHTYKSKSRPDQAQANPGGQATDGNVDGAGITQDVTVLNRTVFPEITWSVLREMPYGGRGNGARGADLNGQRYYATGQAGEFLNAGQGGYGTARLLGAGNKRPVGFTQPAPWTANYYDTTSSVGSSDDPNASPEQQPQAVTTHPAACAPATRRAGRHDRSRRAQEPFYVPRA
jgi:hypothetical protein